MSIGQIIGGAAVIGAFAALLVSNVTQPERNGAAQAELGRTVATPAFSKRVNEAAATPAAPQAAPAGKMLHAVKVEFPSDDRALPAGPGVDLVTQNCTACHSSGMILTQPQLTKATWTAEVTKMQHTYKAPVADADVEPIVAYLATLPVTQ